MLASTELGAGGELQLPHGLRQLLKQEKIYGYSFEGKRHDTGDKLGFLKATLEFALKRDKPRRRLPRISEEAATLEIARTRGIENPPADRPVGFVIYGHVQPS
jgi:UTP-glucose-1-phosphate uridylyltransferase